MNNRFCTSNNRYFGEACSCSPKSNCCVEGPIGPQGPMGKPGPVGPMGPMGPQGPLGAQGPMGIPGPKGVTGATGATGVTGPTGPSGATGPQGIQGEKGATGPAAENQFLSTAETTVQTIQADGTVGLGAIQSSKGTSIIYTAPDLITLDTGVYAISYLATVQDTAGTGSIGASLYINDDVVDYATTYYTNGTDAGLVNLQAIVTIDSLSTVKIENKSTVELKYTNGNMVIVKLQ